MNAIHDRTNKNQEVNIKICLLDFKNKMAAEYTKRNDDFKALSTFATNRLTASESSIQLTLYTSPRYVLYLLE